MDVDDLDRLCVNTIRTLSMDAVQQANSGHPGTPMAMAPVVYDLWQRHLRFDPADPIWPNRDRFVLSAGQLLLYTDGITEAEDAADVEYGEERVRAFLDAHRLDSPRAMVDGLLANVLLHCGPATT